MWIVVWAAASARAADWPMLQGTEAAGADTIHPWGFVNVTGEAIVGGRPAAGLSPALAAFEGQRPTFDRLGPGDATVGVTLRRARAGLRGAVPGTDDRVNWLVGVEFGDSGLTRVDPVVVTDASVTASYVPGVRLRAGQFKLPLGEEALEMNPLAAEFVNLSAASAQLLAESPVTDGAYVGGASGFRDLGLQAFDTFHAGHGELSYAVMVSNGRMGTIEIDDPKDVTARLAVTPVVWGEPRAGARDELGAWVFHQQGRRDVDGDVVPRIRQGVGVKLERRGWQVRGELIRAVGALDLGPTPPFPGQPVQVSASGAAIGGYGYVHHEWTHAAAGVRYDELHRSIDSDADRRVFRTVTFDLQAIATPKARLLLDYEARWLAAPTAGSDARAIAATLGDRLSLQASAVF